MTSENELPKVVVDTNIVVSALINALGAPYRIMTAWRRGAFILLLTADLGAEYIRVLHRARLAQRYGLTNEDRDAFLLLARANAVLVNPADVSETRVRDGKDVPVLAAALGGQADYLVSGDDDLLTLRDHPALGDLKIVTAREFVAAIEPSP